MTIEFSATAMQNLLMKSISLEQLNETLKAQPAGSVLLDVRTPKEFSEGYIPGALNIPIDELAMRTNELKSAKTIYVYCKMGGRAVVACEMLEAMGFKDLEVVDELGFPAWKSLGFPTA
jgi:phage shock protein E